MDLNRKTTGALGLLLLLTMATGASAATGTGPWVSAGLGYNGLAMDDINSADVRWYEESPEGFNLPDINSDFALSFGLGYDMSPVVGYGFYWEHQYAGAKGTDVDVDGHLNLGADLFIGRVTARFIRKESFLLGVAGGIGFVSTSGKIDASRSGTNYGEQKITGSTFSLDGALIGEVVLGEKTLLDISVGYRYAKVDEFKVAGAPAYDADGDRMSIDYSGFMTRVGVKFRFGSGEGVQESRPDIN